MHVGDKRKRRNNDARKAEGVEEVGEEKKRKKRRSVEKTVRYEDERREDREVKGGERKR
jgi:hypothetical protein